MMSKKQWFVLFCVFLCYILFGATVFYAVESAIEEKKLLKEESERDTIEELLRKYYIATESHSLDDLHYKISDYCSKPLGSYEPQNTSQLTWSFYHSVFFVLTIVSTIGYGNLVPTTPFTRTFMIIYGLIGIPINGIVIITLGGFFGKSFLKVYNRWKNSNVNRSLTTLGLIGQIILCSIPGLTFFIFIPSIIFVLYEEWTYDIAIEFAFATLTTIGVGNNVPGTRENNHGKFLFAVYRMFLILWVIMGLGYLAMVFGFISRGLQSKHLHAIEHKIACNIKKTNRRIRQEFRSILNEYLFLSVKPVYRERRKNISTVCGRTQSCPDLLLRKKRESPIIRRRAVSELTKPSWQILPRARSETDLQCIDKERTFMHEIDLNESNKFLLRVANALGNYNRLDTVLEELNNKEDFKTGSFNPNWPFIEMACNETRPRAASDSKKERADLKLRLANLKNLKREQLIETKNQEAYGRTRSKTLPSTSRPYSLFTKLKDSFRSRNRVVLQRKRDIESQNCTNSNDEDLNVKSSHKMVGGNRLLEETSLADFLRALGKIDISKPRRKFGIAYESPPNIIRRTRRLAIAPSNLSIRRTSLIRRSEVPNTNQRRFSLDPSFTLNSNRSGISSAFHTIKEVEYESETKKENMFKGANNNTDEIKYTNEKDKQV